MARYSTDVRPNKQIDTVLSTPLFALPTSAIAHIPGDPGPVALPQRTLLRHLTWSLPSGQAVARRLQVPRLIAADLSDLATYGHGLDRSTPLWLYVLREAQLVNGGQFLGPVGGRIVAEVMLGLLRADPTSYLNQQPHWQPSLGGSGGELRDHRLPALRRRRPRLTGSVSIEDAVVSGAARDRILEAAPSRGRRPPGPVRSGELALGSRDS